MDSELDKQLFKLLNEATVSDEKDFTKIYHKLTKDIIIEAAELVLILEGANNENAFIIYSKDKKLNKVSVLKRIETILKKFITNEATGEVSHKNENAKRAINKVSELLLEALYRVATKDTNELNDEVKKYYTKLSNQFHNAVYLFKDYHYDEYKKLPMMISHLENNIVEIKEKRELLQKALNKEDRIKKATDKELESKEAIKNDFNLWSNANLTDDKISPVLAWLYHSIIDIKGTYPPTATETFFETWAPELEDAGIDPDKVTETTEGRWGLSLIVRLSNKAITKLKKEAETNETAKTALESLTSVTTLKRIGMETWVEKLVLTDKGNLTGNYWIIELIKKLNDLAEADGGYPFDIGENKNNNLTFTFIEEEDDYDF